jgi:hypothetical protein
VHACHIILLLLNELQTGLLAALAPLFTFALQIPLIIVYYGLCSSTLIVINKVAVHTLRAPTFILIIQLLFAASTVQLLKLFRVLEAENLQWKLVRPFLLIVAGFLGTLFANIKVLVFSNVETFITFRCDYCLAAVSSADAITGQLVAAACSGL